jgi:hypothetical protein
VEGGTTSERVVEEARRGVVVDTAAELAAPDALALRLLAAAALAIAFICLLILPSGPHEADETQSWVLAVLVAIPSGFGIASIQERRLLAAAPAAAARGVAVGIVSLALALLVRRLGHGDAPFHAIVLVAALAAVGAPFLAARVWRDRGDRDVVPAHVIAAVWLVAIVILFTPNHAWRVGNLAPAILLAAALTAFLLWLPHRRALAGHARWAVDTVLCVLLAAVVVQLPPVGDYLQPIAYHQGFFLGPANDVLHGRAMMAGAWSQYGYGLIDALAGIFKVVPIGFGTMMLIVVAATVAEYVCVFVTLRIAGLGQSLVVLTVGVAVASNLFAPLFAYILYPSAGPIRFGLPYLIVLLAVIGARLPERRAVVRYGMLAAVGLAAAWSFETFTYTAATYGCLILVEALAEPSGKLRTLIRGAVEGIGASVFGVVAFSLITLALDGHLDWGPYVEYLKLYTTEELGALPVVIFSAGPQMGATIFFTGVAVLWVTRYRPDLLEAPVRAALTGFTGIALSTYTYYLGRSHPNNLLVIVVPTILLVGLWIHVLLKAGPNPWRNAALAGLALGWAIIAVAAWPSVEEKWDTTALSLAAPHNAGSLRIQIDEYAENPALNHLAPLGTRLLDRYWQPGEPALVLTQQDLTTEVLLRSGRRNLLPISHPPEDVIIESSFGRVRESAHHVPAGTLMLYSPPPVIGGQVTPDTELPTEFNKLQDVALRVLRKRFDFEPVAGSAQTLEVVRLVRRDEAS